ncbi:MAG TPA: AarF/UbiB family protein [Acidimicrobiales bacterium]|nr:AarF/UbiB family protein [Acidimicrobiales bacterium]
MSDVAGTLVKHRKRLNEVARVLARHGLASLVARGGGLAGAAAIQGVVDHVVAPEDAQATDGERLRDALAELGTTFVKFGQMLSLRPDVVGADVAAELSKLQASVPPDPPGVAQAAVERQFARPVSELFGSFEAEPFASGSVAQVHRATLFDGTPVAVKVVHDGAEDRVRADLDVMRAIAGYLEEEDPQLARLRPTVMVAEFDAMMRAAIDMRQERSNLQRFQANFAGEPDVVIPTPYPELSGQKVLTMALITGHRFTDRASVEAAGWDPDELVQRAAAIYLEMIFRDGIFHADPHPGNFVLPDGEHLALLDFGDVGRLTGQRRRQLGSLLIAIAARDVETFIDVVLEMTTPPPGVDVGELRASIELWLDRHLMVGVAELDMAEVITSLMALLHQHQLVLPADLALLFRTLLNLQGLGQGVGTEVQVNELLKPYVTQMMTERFDPRALVRQFARAARNWDHFVTRLPGDLQAILQQLRSGQIGVDFRVHDADGAVDRLVDGLVTAASLLAGAELISRRAGPVVGPFSVPGLVVAGVGLLTWQRLIARRQKQTWVSRARKMAQLART